MHNTTPMNPSLFQVMKKISIILIFIVLSLGLKAQGCLPEGIIFTTQAQIDSFPVNYPGCTEIEGNVKISGGDIINLNGLESINIFHDGLEISNCQSLINLNGLSSLHSVENYFSIFNNSGLQNLTGIGNLDSIKERFTIQFNNLLSNLAGLNSIIYIGDLTIANNESLTDLSGLENLSSLPYGLDILMNNSLESLGPIGSISEIGGNVEIVGNKNLTSLSGLENITSIGGELLIRQTEKMQSLSGIENVNSIGGDLRIFDNVALNDLSALENTTSIDGSIWIFRNSMLTTLHGLENINPESILELHLFANPILSVCEVQSICNYLTSPNGVINIDGNLMGCNSEEEVEAACLVGQQEMIPDDFCQVFPNPTSGLLRFSFTITEPTGFSIEIVNSLGQKINGPEPGYLSSGANEIIWNASHLPDGIYYYKLQTDNQTVGGKLILMK